MTRRYKLFFVENKKWREWELIRRLREHLSKDEMGQSGDHSIRHNRPATFLALSKQHRWHSREKLQMDLCSLLPVQVSSFFLSRPFLFLSHGSLRKRLDLELFNLLLFLQHLTINRIRDRNSFLFFFFFYILNDLIIFYNYTRFVIN